MTIFGRAGLQQQIAVSLDDHDEIIEVVGNASGEAANRFQSRGTQHSFARKKQAFPHLFESAGELGNFVSAFHCNTKVKLALLHLAAGLYQVFQRSRDLSRKEESHDCAREHSDCSQHDKHLIERAQKACCLVIRAQRIESDWMITRQVDETAKIALASDAH